MKREINFKAALLLLIVLVQTTSCRNVQKSSNILDEPEMVFVQGGTFTMGCSSEWGDDCSYDDRPTHQVTVSNYYIGKYEVSQAQWKAVMGYNPSSCKGDNLPVESVTWDDVQEFIYKLNSLTGKSYRLPTEAEWEYAARGGNKSKGYKYSGSNDIDDVAWYRYNSGDTLQMVGTKAPNELGIYDMSGHVSEWCSDWYDDYHNFELVNPKGPSSGDYHVYRGGGLNNDAWATLVSSRYGGSPDFHFYTLGFRLSSNYK